MRGYPTEGLIGDQRRISARTHRAQSVALDATIADVVALGELEHPIAVLGPGDVLLGSLQPASRSLPPATPVDRVMIPAPGTIRPDIRIDDALRQMRNDHIDHVFVTTVGGELVGRVVTGDVDA